MPVNPDLKLQKVVQAFDFVGLGVFLLVVPKSFDSTFGIFLSDLIVLRENPYPSK